MSGRYKTRNIITFQKEFPDDQACLKHLVQQRWPDGFVCPKCGNQDAWNIIKRGQHDCKECRYADTIEQFLDRLGCGQKTDEGHQLLETIRSDGWRSYGMAARNKEITHCKVILRDPKLAGKLLPWLHRVIANAKSVISGTQRGVSEKHLQSYFSEITCRFNRRFWEAELFDRLVQACVRADTITYENLIKKR